MGEPLLNQTLAQVRDTPDFKVLVAGRELAPEMALDLLAIEVEEHVEGADHFAVTINAWDAEVQEFQYLDGEPFREGVEVEVQAGYTGALETLLVGEVTALEPEFPTDEAPTLRACGYDRLHRLRRGRKTRTFLGQKDSQVADRIARDLGLTPRVEDSGVVHEYLLQYNQSDIDFLMERARRIHFEVVVEGGELLFRPAPYDRAAVVSLNYGFSLKSFSPRLSTVHQVSEVKVQGWNPATKEAIQGSARAGDEVAVLGSNAGPTVAEAAFFATESVVVDRPVASVGEAQQMARGKYNDMALGLIRGEGTAIGAPGIRAGVVIELLGLGGRWSGLYYVTDTCHRVGPEGYLTTFSVERNAR